MLRALAFLLLSMMIFACSGPDYSSGTPSSTETQNSIAGRILLPDGTPASYARISAFPADDQTGSQPTETQCDQRGAFKIQVPDTSLYSIVVENESGNAARFLMSAKVTEDTVLHMDTTHSIYVGLNPGSFGERSLLRIHILGTQLQAEWNTANLLPLRLPGHGSYAVSATNGTDSRTALFFVGAETDTVWLTLPSLPSLSLLDFESSCYQNNLSTILGEGWNFYMDGNDTLVPSGTLLDFGTTCMADSLHGQVSHISFEPSHANSWFILGTGFGDASIGVDLSGLDSLVFWAKGSCELDVGFITYDMLDFKDYQYPQSPAITITSEWTRYSIPSSSLTYPEGSQGTKQQLSWLISSSRTLIVQWSSQGSCDLWLDDVQLFGVSYPEMKLKP